MKSKLLAKLREHNESSNTFRYILSHILHFFSPHHHHHTRERKREIFNPTDCFLARRAQTFSREREVWRAYIYIRGKSFRTRALCTGEKIKEGSALFQAARGRFLRRKRDVYISRAHLLVICKASRAIKSLMRALNS